MAEVLGLRDPQYGWHQGATLRSLTVIETGAAEAGPTDSEPVDGPSQDGPRQPTD